MPKIGRQSLNMRHSPGSGIVEKRVGVHDLHATILHQLGLDHRRLTYHHPGREETLTDFPATGAYVVNALLRA